MVGGWAERRTSWKWMAPPVERRGFHGIPNLGPSHALAIHFHEDVPGSVFSVKPVTQP